MRFRRRARAKKEQPVAAVEVVTPPPAAVPLPSTMRSLLPVLTGAVVAAWLAILLWRAATLLGGVLAIVVIAWFLSLAMDPLVAGLMRHRVRRGPATGLVMFVSLAGVVAVAWVFGDLFVEQLVALVASLPIVYGALRDGAAERFGVVLPESDEVVANALARWGDDLAVALLTLGGSVVGAIATASSVLLVAYYMTAYGPRLRATICRTLSPERQAQVLYLWELSTAKVSDFINSRILLAGLCTVFTGIFLTIVKVPYALPLALFTGVVSQFVPTIGTYIGGALPIAVALSISVPTGLAVLLFVIGYQQVENLVFSPKVSARSLELNPAVSFLAVIAFGAVFGPLGAFLGLPVAATVQAVANTYVRRHDLIESAMLPGPEPTRSGRGASTGRVRRLGEKPAAGA